METITIISNNLYIYIFLVLLSGFLLIRNPMEFNKEKLLDYLIYLTNKIILFFIFISFIFVTILTLLNETTLILNFIEELSNMILIYALFNYSIFYVIKFGIWFIDFYKTNELMTFALSKEVKAK